MKQTISRVVLQYCSCVYAKEGLYREAERNSWAVSTEAYPSFWGTMQICIALIHDHYQWLPKVKQTTALCQSLPMMNIFSMRKVLLWWVWILSGLLQLMLWLPDSMINILIIFILSSCAIFIDIAFSKKRWWQCQTDWVTLLYSEFFWWDQRVSRTIYISLSVSVSSFLV